VKTIILIEQDRVQLVLKPEGKHDEEVAKILESLPGAQRTSLYARNGGYTGFDGIGDEGKDLMVIFDTTKGGKR
jgi:hypothetical protein